MNNLKKLSLAFIAFVLLALTPFTGYAAGRAEFEPQETGKTGEKTHELILLHTNDHHGAIMPVDGQGGLAERAAFVKSVRAANPNVLLVDAGDINTGSALSNMFDAEPDILAYNFIGYDAVTFGNHEFDGSQEKLNRQITTAQFPFVSSNIQTADGNFLGGHQYLVKDYDGFRLGLLGITTLRTLTMAGPTHFVHSDLSFIPEIEAAREAISILRNREKADIVIALAHMGESPESPDHITSDVLAAAVPGIDIIVDGHSHTMYEGPHHIENTWIVIAGDCGRYVGQGKLSIVNGKLADFDWEPKEINSPDWHMYDPDGETAALIAPYREKADASLKEVIGEAAETFALGSRLPRYQETAIGNMIADSNVWYFKTVFGQDIDFAFHNGGTIRAELPKGNLTREHILTVLPFENYLSIVTLSGSKLLELFDFIAGVHQGSGGFPQFSKEVRYTLDVPNKTISGLTIGGVPVDPEKNYRFCTNDFLLAGGDDYLILYRARERYNTNLLLSYVVTEYIRARQESITPVTDGRMTVIGGAIP